MTAASPQMLHFVVRHAVAGPRAPMWPQARRSTATTTRKADTQIPRPLRNVAGSAGGPLGRCVTTGIKRHCGAAVGCICFRERLSGWSEDTAPTRFFFFSRPERPRLELRRLTLWRGSPVRRETRPQTTGRSWEQASARSTPSVGLNPSTPRPPSTWSSEGGDAHRFHWQRLGRVQRLSDCCPRDCSFARRYGSRPYASGARDIDDGSGAGDREMRGARWCPLARA